jgi:chromosome segregation ATPase
MGYNLKSACSFLKESRMQKLQVAIVLLVMGLAVMIIGCGPDTKAQLKETQANLTTCDRQAAELNAALLKLRGDYNKQTQELAEAKNDLKFFANKVNPLEQQGYELKGKIEALTKELEDTKKELAATKQQLEAAKEDLAGGSNAAAPKPTKQ